MWNLRLKFAMMSLQSGNHSPFIFSLVLQDGCSSRETFLPLPLIPPLQIVPLEILLWGDKFDRATSELVTRWPSLCLYLVLDFDVVSGAYCGSYLISLVHTCHSHVGYYSLLH